MNGAMTDRMEKIGFTGLSPGEKLYHNTDEFGLQADRSPFAKPTPLVWTADGDLILGKVQRLFKRISNS